MKFRLMLLTILILSLVLSACGGGGDGGDPTKPVKDFFDAFTDLDAEKAAEAICEQYRKDTQAGLEMIFGFLAMAEDSKIEIVDLELKVEDKSDDEAMIIATSGTLRITIAGEVQEETDFADESEPLKVVKEDGEWYVCDDAFIGDMAP